MGVLANIRNDYNLKALSEKDLLANPIEQASQWLQEAIGHSIYEPTAMNLSTISATGRPTSRIVLLKEINSEGFVFFTNYKSKKGKELEANPFAALTLFWKELERQVRIEGIVKRISPDLSDSYFNSRPLQSRIGAIVSPQSSVIETREELEEQVKLMEKLPEEEIIRPAHWGGYVVVPDYIEFWQGRTSRLHDRFAYTLQNHQWKIERLAP